MHFYCTPTKLKDASGKHSQCFIKLPDMATSAGAVAQRSNPELLLPYSAFIASDGIANIAHCQINKRRLCLRNHGETTQSRDVPQRRGGESCLGLTVH